MTIRRDNASVPLYVVNEDSDEEFEKARKKAEKEEREERNRFVGFGRVEEEDKVLWLVQTMNSNAQEMEREEGEGVEGGVWANGEEEGGQGHKEQNDGQGVEVPELQVGTDKEMCHHMLR